MDQELFLTSDSAWFLPSSLLPHQLALQRKFGRKGKRRGELKRRKND